LFLISLICVFIQEMHDQYGGQLGVDDLKDAVKLSLELRPYVRCKNVAFLNITLTYMYTCIEER
jgi:hypothetical protein